MKDVIIKIYKDSSVYTENSTLGINYENIQGKLVFEFVDEFVDGTAYLEFERKFEKGLIPMNKVGKTYEIEIKSSLLKEMGNIELQLRITQDEVPNGIPVYKSKVFTLEVLEAINATSEIPDEYPEWIDLANEKIKEMDNLNVTTERVEDGVDIVLTDKKGNTTRTEVKDGAPGPAGPQGEPGAVKMQVVDTLPETGRTDTIYLVKKDNPGEQNLYDEYVYTDTGWEHIGDTSVDLSNYQEKLTPGDNINIDNNVISATFQKEVIELTDETIVLKDLEVGIYRITRSVLHIKTGNTVYNIAGNWNCLMLVDYYRNSIKRGYIFSEGNIWCFTDEDYGYVGIPMKDIMSTRAVQTIAATHTYNILPTSEVVPTQDNQFTNKKYVDDAVANINIPMYTITTTKSFMDGYVNFETDFLNKLTELVNKNLDTGFELFVVDIFNNTFRFDIYMTTPSDTVNVTGRLIGYGLGRDFYNKVRTFTTTYSAKDGLYTFSKVKTDSTKTTAFESDVLTKTNTTEYTPTGNYNPSTKLYTDKTHYENMTGYDATKTQVLKNINGTLTWVNE